MTDIDQTVIVSNVKVTGSTVFEDEDFAPILAELSPGPSVEELRRAADQITALYLEQGYITSRAIVATEDSTAGGVAELRVIEGKVDGVDEAMFF